MTRVWKIITENHVCHKQTTVRLDYFSFLPKWCLTKSPP